MIFLFAFFIVLFFRGSFAETQATFMTPDPSTVVELDASLTAKNMGVVAHYYMDAELQVRGGEGRGVGVYR